MDPVTSYGTQCFRHNTVPFIKVAMIRPTNVSVWKDVALVMKPTDPGPPEAEIWQTNVASVLSSDPRIEEEQSSCQLF
jgi:hypothetical protein